MRTIGLSIVLLWCLLCGTLLTPVEAGGMGTIDKDQAELGLAVGSGSGVIITWKEDTSFSETVLRWGRYSAPLRLGILSGHAGWLVEGIALARVTNPSAYGAGIAFVPRYLLTGTGSRLRPFVTAGLGALWTNKKVPSRTSDFNFKSHFGLGLKSLWQESWGLEVEARFVHISNNGMDGRNPGINVIEFLLGFYLTP